MEYIILLLQYHLAKFQVQVSQSRKPTCYLILNVLQYWLDNDQEDGIRDKRNGAGF